MCVATPPSLAAMWSEVVTHVMAFPPEFARVVATEGLNAMKTWEGL